jgi:hypothetical protein
MRHAIDRRAVIITADTDFGALLAHGGRTEPSVILVRELLSLPVASQGRLLAANLDQVREVLITGSSSSSLWTTSAYAHRIVGRYLADPEGGGGYPLVAFGSQWAANFGTNSVLRQHIGTTG